MAVAVREVDRLWLEQWGGRGCGRKLMVVNQVIKGKIVILVLKHN